MKKTNFILWVFTTMSFVLAMTSFVFNGILDQVALSLNVSVAKSGLLNTMYAYGAAFGAPVTLVVFRKVERTKMLKIALVATILMTIALIFAQNFWQMLLIRFIMGISGNSYGVLAIVTVVALAPKEKQGRAMAFLITGASLALVIGIPLTRLLSSLLDWRSIFNGLTVMMFLAWGILLMFLPKGDHEATKVDIKNELSFLKDGITLLVITYTLIMFIGYGALYTYVTPYLLILFPSVEALMSGLLLLLGISAFLGNLLGGHVSDWLGYRKSMLIGAIWQLVAIILIVVSAPYMWINIAMVVIWISGGWFTGLQLNTGIAQATHNRSSFMISLNSSAIQLGTALGSSMAATIIPQTHIRNIVFITLFTSLAILLVQILSLKKYKASAIDPTTMMKYDSETIQEG